MVASCFYCGKRNSKSYVSFHKFPTSTSERCKVWVKNMGFDENFVLPANSKLCSDHFEENYFSKNNNDRGRILPESVPTKFGRYYLKCICCENIKTIGSHVSFRKFPLKNNEVLRKWITNIGQENFLPNDRSLICDDHFEEHCFYKGKTSYNILKSTAIPTIFEKNVLRDYASSTVMSVDQSIEKMDIPFKRNNKISSMLAQNLSHTDELSNCKHSVNYDDVIQMDADNISMESDFAERSPETLEMPVSPKFSDINHDHHYHSTPSGQSKRYDRLRQSLKESRTEAYVQRQQIKRLKKKISTLSDIVNRHKNYPVFERER